LGIARTQDAKYRLTNEPVEVSAMEEMINQMVAKVGIDRATAERVVQFLKDNADELPKWLGNIGLPSGILDQVSGLFGGKK
jgi:hypothetical protein